MHSDKTVKIWDTNTGNILHSLVGHTSRIWDVCSNDNGSFVASGSGDGTVKLWDLKYKCHCALTLKSTEDNIHGDVYSVDFHPGYGHIAAGGYDKVLRLYDIHAGKLVKSFGGHELSISKAIFNPIGNLLISGYSNH